MPTKGRPPAGAAGDCPMTRLIGVIASKWAMPVLYNLLRAAGPVRFTVLRRSIGRVTQRELSLTLKRFEEIGVVHRRVYPEVPPRVEYRLTALGRSLEEPILGLGRWAERHASELTAAGQRAARAKASRASR
ncbi:MAG: helix-turn-helix domain-containing protein [Bryobacteraceae bacterium]